jgi:hypothetical protein
MYVLRNVRYRREGKNLYFAGPREYEPDPRKAVVYDEDPGFFRRWEAVPLLLAIIEFNHPTTE